MPRLATTLLMLCLNEIPALCGKKPPPVWKTAKVLDSQAVKERAGTVDAAAITSAIRDADLILVSDDFIYVIEDRRVGGNTSLFGVTARAVSNRHHGCRFIIADDIRYWQEKAFLHVRDADGKECRVEIKRQERLQPPTMPPAKQ